MVRGREGRREVSKGKKKEQPVYHKLQRKRERGKRQRDRGCDLEKTVFLLCVCVSKTMNPFRAQLYNIRKRYVNNTCKNFFGYNKQFFLYFLYVKEGVEKTAHSSLLLKFRIIIIKNHNTSRSGVGCRRREEQKHIFLREYYLHQQNKKENLKMKNLAS